MLDKLEAFGLTAGHAAELIFDRTAAVDPWADRAGGLLYLAAQAVRPRGWHTILRAAFPEATDLRPRDVIRLPGGRGRQRDRPRARWRRRQARAYAAGIEGARYSTLAATFIPETLFETAFGTALVAWGLAMGFIPVPHHQRRAARARRLAGPRASRCVRSLVAPVLVVVGPAARARAARRPAPGDGDPLLAAALPRRRRELAGPGTPHPPGLDGGLHGRLRPPGDAGHRRARHGGPGRRADPAARPGERRACAWPCSPTASSR